MTKAVWFFLKRHRTLYAVLTVVLLSSALLETLSVAALFPLMTSILGGESISGGGRLLSMLELAATVIPLRDPVVASVVLLAGIITAKSLTLLLREYLITSTGASVVFSAKQEMFNRLIQAPYQYLVDPRQKDLNYRLTTAPQGLGLMLLLVPSILAQMLIMIAITILLSTISWQLTAAVLMFGVIIYWALREVAKRISHVVGKRRTSAMTRELGVVVEFLAGVKEIVSGRAAGRWARLYRQEGQELRRVHVKDSVWQSIPGVLIEWAFFVLVGLIAITIHAARGGALTATIPVVAVYAYALYRIIRALSILSSYKLRLSSQLADVELLYRTLNEPFPTLHEGSAVHIHFEDSIKFDKVSFAYPNRSEYALRDISLTLPKGTTTALVGQSGAGKTTLVNLLLRLYDQKQGNIRVDGRDLGDYHRDAWLRLVGYVSQEVFILNGTVADNIQFGLNVCRNDDVEVAARAAHAHEFIAELPEGYATILGDRGMTLSGGQRQRIAIARALLRNPEILIFDEATSALDSVSEKLIREAIKEMAKKYTLILVAHRLSTVRFADQIVVLDRGKVIEVGSHEYLLAQKGQYSLLMASTGG